jgi:ribokinase
MSGKIPKIVSVGAAVQDVFMSQSDEFTPVTDKSLHEQVMQLEMGGKADVNKIDFSTGGGATNASVTFARAGLQAIFMGTIAHDPAGQAVIEELDSENVDTSHVSYSDKFHTGYSMLLLAPNGERSILTYRGASTHYDIRNFDLSTISADWLYVSSVAGQMAMLSKLFHQAKEKGMKIFFNPGKGELAHTDKLKALLKDVDVLSVNKEEMQQIVHGETSDELVRHGLALVDALIVSDGPRGVTASDGKTIVQAGMYKDVKVLDRTGAGDAFGSGFLSQWATGSSLKDAIIYGSANSTSVVTHIGAKKGILHHGVQLHSMPIKETNV